MPGWPVGPSARRTFRHGPAPYHRHAAGGRRVSSELAAILRRCRPACSPATCGVLQQARIITRRSEGHDCRTCLRLIPGTLDTLSAPLARQARRVLFVSPRTRRARIWRRRCGAASTVPAASAGTGRPRDRGGRHRRRRRHRLPLRGLRPRHIYEVQQDGDLIVAVCDTAHEGLRQRPAIHWSVPTRSGRDAGGLRRCAGQLRHRIERFARAWRRLPGGAGPCPCGVGRRRTAGQRPGAGANGDEHRRVAAGDGVQRCGGRRCRGLADDDQECLHATEAGERGAGRTRRAGRRAIAGPETEAEQQHEKHDTGRIRISRSATTPALAASVSAVAIAVGTRRADTVSTTRPATCRTPSAPVAIAATARE